MIASAIAQGIITCAFLAHPSEEMYYSMLAASETAPSFDGSDGGVPLSIPRTYTPHPTPYTLRLTPCTLHPLLMAVNAVCL